MLQRSASIRVARHQYTYSILDCSLRSHGLAWQCIVCLACWEYCLRLPSSPSDTHVVVSRPHFFRFILERSSSTFCSESIDEVCSHELRFVRDHFVAEDALKYWSWNMRRWSPFPGIDRIVPRRVFDSFRLRRGK